MTTFTASEVRESAIVVVSRDMEYEAEMLRAYADRLEADEKAAPAAWLASCPGPTCVSAPFLTREEAQECGNAWDHCYVTPLYTHPSPADTERLAELLRGLEIGPMAAMLSPKELFAIGAAIAAQAKEAQPPAASLTFATPKTEEDVMAYLRIAKLHIKRFREILQAALAAQENPNG